MYVFPSTGSGGALQPNLAAIVGAIPAGYNMLPTPGGTQGFQTDWTDFANARNWSLIGSEFVTTPAQLTLVTGLSGPDRSGHATKLVETTYNGNHSIISFVNSSAVWNQINAPIPLRLAAVVRAIERTRIVISFGDGSVHNTAALLVSIGYDLAGGNTGYDNSVGASMTLLGTHMTNLGGGWWLCYFDHYISSGAMLYPTLSNNGYQPALYLDNGSGTAARSISYAGDGTSGLEVLWFNWLPVHMWNLTQNTFNDDFNSLSTIDLTNSGAPGFNWYINNRFQNAGQWGLLNNQNFWNSAVNNIPSNPSNFSISSPSILQMYEPAVSASPGYTNQLMSVVSNSNTPGAIPGYIGTVFSAPMLIECSASFDASATDVNPYWQGDGVQFWGSTIPTLTDVGYAADGKFHFMELDWAGGGNLVRSGNMGCSGFDWSSPQSFVAGELSFVAGGYFRPGTIDQPSMTFANGFRKMSALWVNAAYNNYTWGYFMGFADGQWASPVLAYSAGGADGPTPGGISLADGHKLPLFIVVAGSNNNLAPAGMKGLIDWIRVWQPPSIPTVYAFWNAFDMGVASAAGLAPTLSQNGYQVTKPGADASWRSARAHKYAGFNNVGGGVSAGKWYWEHTLTGSAVGNTSGFMLGIGNTAALVSTNPGGSAKGAGLQYNTAANTNLNGVTGLTASAITWVSGDVIGFAFDADAGHVYIHKNGTYINGNPGSGNGVWTVTSDTWWPMVAMLTAGTTNAVSSNFGQAAFAFTVPAGYNAGVF